MSNITIFNHPMFGQVRVITDDTSKELLFCANDVTDALGYSNGRKAVADHVEKDDVTKRDIIDNLGRMQSATFINESGVYSLIFGSKQERAKEFKRWVTSEVLPPLILSRDIKDCGFSVRILNALKGFDVYTVGDLVRNLRGRSELMKLRNLGNKSVYSILDFVEENNLDFKENGESEEDFYIRLNNKLSNQKD